MKKRFIDKPGYFTFTFIGSLIIIIGVLMNIFRFNSSTEIKYDIGDTDKFSISGSQVIILGVTMLIGVSVYYMVDRQRKGHK